MRLASAGSHGMDRATAWTLAGGAAATVLLARLALVDYQESSGLFHPHGYCYLWLPSLVSTHVISDLLIGLSYVSISGTLAYLVWRARRELPYSWMFVAFGAFIVCCGATHFMEVWTLWTPVFWLSLGVKIVTAVASVATAVALPPLVPKVLRLVADARLSEQRRLQLEEARAELEQRVTLRTLDLEQARRHYQALAESLPHLVWTCRPDGYCDYLSRQWVEYTGVPTDEQIGYGWAQQVHPDDRDRVQAEWAQATARGDTFDIEFRIRRGDGVYRWFKTRAVPLHDESGVLVKWFGSNTDFEDYKQAMDDLRRSNADLEQFAYIASHDLQEPLRMVASYTELLARRYQGQLDETADKYIYYATDGAKRMQRLVADLLAYSRVGSQGGRLQPVKSGEVLTITLDTLSGPIRDAGAEVEVVGELPVVLADESQLFQVFQNLVANAIKFRSTAPPKVSVQAIPRGDSWLFSIRDNGIGINMRYADRIFHMFQRLHDKRKYEGSGIGLAIAKRIVERHGGQIWVESDGTSQGSTFYIRLPR